MARKDGNKRPKVHLEIQQHRKNPLGYLECLALFVATFFTQHISAQCRFLDNHIIA